MNDATPYSYCKMPGANVNGILACEVIAEMHAILTGIKHKFRTEHPELELGKSLSKFFLDKV